MAAALVFSQPSPLPTPHFAASLAGQGANSQVSIRRPARVTGASLPAAGSVKTHVTPRLGSAASQAPTPTGGHNNHSAVTAPRLAPVRPVQLLPPGPLARVYNPSSNSTGITNPGTSLDPADGITRLPGGRLAIPYTPPPAAPAPAAPAAAPAQPAAAPAPAAPPPPPQPVLTEAMIADAFHHTPFAKPTATIQPVGGRTLVTLDTYVQLVWDQHGFAPGSTDNLTMLGHTVALRPQARTFAYHFGDGATIGPTPSTGGPYPIGDVKHPYSRAGRYQITITATYTADYSIDGGPWNPLNDTVDIPGPPSPIDVHTATNELVNGTSS